LNKKPKATDHEGNGSTKGARKTFWFNSSELALLQELREAFAPDLKKPESFKGPLMLGLRALRDRLRMGLGSTEVRTSENQLEVQWWGEGSVIYLEIRGNIVSQLWERCAPGDRRKVMHAASEAFGQEMMVQLERGEPIGSRG
jgi:hypothetical protein